jgi:adenosylmethionine-8-amino-7-oxononanoate aminotransferase
LTGLQGLKARHELVGDARGKGLMCCIELVSDRQKKTPAAKDVVQNVQDMAYRNGVMIRTSGSNIILSPPLIIAAQDVQRIISALDAALFAAVP